jgi:hypothetical protein
MTGNELERLTKALRSDPKMQKAIQRLDRGIGTYKDVNRMAVFIGRRIAEEMGISFSEEALTNYLVAGHGLVAMSAEAAQTNLNNAAKIGLKPKLTKTPNAKIAKAVATVGAAEPEAVTSICENVLPTLMLEMVDDIQRYNADFQQKSGLHPIIRRTWSGSYPSHDTRHTDNCEQMAGEWEYGDRPDDVFWRHEGCRCTVEYFPSKGAEGQITALAKYDVARNGELGAKEETLERRLKNAARQRELDKKYGTRSQIWARRQAKKGNSGGQ